MREREAGLVGREVGSIVSCEGKVVVVGEVMLGRLVGEVGWLVGWRGKVGWLEYNNYHNQPNQPTDRPVLLTTTNQPERRTDRPTLPL